MRKKALMILLLALFCAPQKTFAQKEPAYGGTLVIGTRMKPEPLHPFLTRHSVSVFLNELIFSPLVRMGEAYEFSPELALSWDISDNKKIHTFHLRKDAFFHDGEKVTADDVIFTYDYFLRHKDSNNYYHEFTAKIEKLEKVDDYTVSFYLYEPDGFLQEFSDIVILPEHLLAEGRLTDREFGDNPVGSGPFVFKERSPNGEVVLGANINYYSGRPYLDYIETRLFEDNEAIWSAMLRQKIDLALFLKPEDYKILKEDSTYKAYSFPAAYYYAALYNYNDPDYSNDDIRKAVALAVDIDALIKIGLEGSGDASTGPFSDLLLGRDTSDLLLEYCPQKSRQILDDLGWCQIDKDGVRHKDGRPLELRLLVNNTQKTDLRVAFFLRQQLSRIGIKTRLLRFDDFSEIEEKYNSDRYPQAWLNVLYGGLDIRDVYTSWCGPKMIEKDFFKFYSDYHSELQDEFVQLNDEIKIQNSFSGMFALQKKLYNDSAVLFLAYPYMFCAVSSCFANTDEFFNVYFPFDTIKNWYLSKK